MPEPSTPPTPDSPLPHSPEVSSGPQFRPADEPAPAPAPAGYTPDAAAAPEYPQPYPDAAGADPLPTPEAHPDSTPPPENVGRGIAFSLLAIVLGAVLAALVYQLGFIASITSFAMALAAVWLYVKGAGAPPRAGIWPLIGVIVVGVIIALVAMVGWSLYSELARQYPDATAGDLLPYTFELLLNPEVWSYIGTDVLIFVGFAALGTFTTLRQLRRSTEA